jgi:hypothetical protein
MARKIPGNRGNGVLLLLEKGETANPKGRPPCLLSSVVSDLKAHGYERATAGTVVEAFEMLLNVPEEVLVDLRGDKQQPMSVRIICKAMTSAKGWDVLQAIMDRTLGRPKQSITATVTEVPRPVIIMSHADSEREEPTEA